MPVDHPSITIQPQDIWLWLDNLIGEVLCGVRSCLSFGTEERFYAGLLSPGGFGTDDVCASPVRKYLVGMEGRFYAGYARTRAT